MLLISVLRGSRGSWISCEFKVSRVYRVRSRTVGGHRSLGRAISNSFRIGSFGLLGGVEL